MLPGPHRLRHEKDIKTLFAKGKSVFDPVCGIKYRRNTVGKTRFAVVVGTKVSKRAVDRNRVRRRIRSAIEKHLSSLAPGFDIMVLVRPEALKNDAAALEARIVAVFKKTPVWQGT